MRIAYFGFDLFYDCLVRLAENGHDIIKIFTCDVDEVYESNKRVYNFARKNKIEITSEKVTAKMISELESMDCDLIFCAGYYYKIPISSVIPGVNLHPSLLPQGRGPWPFPNVILKKLRSTGVTIHKLADDFDTGEIVLQSEMFVCADDNLETLTKKSIEASLILIDKFSKNPHKYLADSFPQNLGEYWNEPDVKSMTFTLKNSYEKIDLITRAFYGYGCFVNLCGKTFRIIKAKCIKDEQYIFNQSEMAVKICNGYLRIIKMC